MQKALALLLVSSVIGGAALAAEPVKPAEVVRNNLSPLNPQPLPPLETGRLSSVAAPAQGAGGPAHPPLPATPAGQVPHPEGTGPRQTPVGGTPGQLRERAAPMAAGVERSVPTRSSLSGVLESGSGAGK